MMRLGYRRALTDLYPDKILSAPAVAQARLRHLRDDRAPTNSVGFSYLIRYYRNRHCPKCQGAAACDWMEAREAELLPVPYFHVVFTLPGEIADIAHQNKRVIYGLLFKASAEAMQTIAADLKHFGAKIAITSVLHTWGSASCRRRAFSTMTHHPHVHMIVPGGGLSEDRKRWIACRKGFFLPVPTAAGRLAAFSATTQLIVGGQALHQLPCNHRQTAEVAITQGQGSRCPGLIQSGGCKVAGLQIRYDRALGQDGKPKPGFDHSPNTVKTQNLHAEPHLNVERCGSLFQFVLQGAAVL